MEGIDIVKYRCWDNEQKRFRDDNESKQLLAMSSNINTTFQLPTNEKFAERFIFEQYTGYFESFKGDKVILSSEEPYSNNQFNTDYDWTFEGIVKMSTGMWIVEGADKCCIPFCDILNDEIDFKIIGNIHKQEETNA